MTPRQLARLLARSGARDARARLARRPPHRPRRLAHRGFNGVALSIPRDAGRERSAARGALAASDGPGGPRVFLHGMLSVQPAANTSWRFGQQAPLSPVQQLSDRRPCSTTCKNLPPLMPWQSVEFSAPACPRRTCLRSCKPAATTCRRIRQPGTSGWLRRPALGWRWRAPTR
jgi:hypothetical protein